MAEPVALNVMNSLPRLMPKKGSLNRIANSARSTSLGNNFFTPVARQCNGKMKEVELSPVQNVLEYQDWACSSSKQSLWSSDGSMRSVLMTELSEPGSSWRTRRTTQASRSRLRKTQHSSPSCSYSDNACPPSSSSARHKSFSTSSSAAAAAAKAPKVQYTPYEPQNNSTRDSRRSKDKAAVKEKTVDNLQQNLQHQSKSAKNLDDLFVNFNALNNAGVFAKLPAEQLLQLGESLANHIDGLCVDLVRYEIIAAWGQRLSSLLQHVESHSMSMVDSQRRESLKHRALAFQHQFRESELYLERIPYQSRREHNQVLDTFQSAFMSHVLALANKEGMSACLEFLYAAGNSKYYKYVADYYLFRKLVLNVKDIKHAISSEALRKPYAMKPMIDSLVRISCKAKDYHRAMAIIDVASQLGASPSPQNVLHTCLGLATHERGYIPKAQSLFETVPEVDIDLYWKVKLYLAGRRGEDETAKEVIEKLQAKNALTDNDITLALDSKVKEGRLEEFQAAFDSFFPIGEDGRRIRKPNIYHYTIAAQADALRVDPIGVNNLLEDMKKSGVMPTTIFCTSLMQSFAKKGDITNVLSTYEYMREAGLPLDNAAYTVLITVVARKQDCEAATKIYIQAIEDGVVPDETMTNSLMNAYVEAGSWRDAVDVFHHLTSLPADLQPPIDTYNIILKAYVLAGAPFRLISKLFRRLEEIGGRPDTYTFAALIQSAADVEDVYLCKRLYRDVKRRQDQHGYNSLISPHILTLLMNAFLRRHHSTTAKKMFHDMIDLGFQPTAVTFGQIVQSYGQEGTPEKMKMATDFVKKLLEDRSWVRTNSRDYALSHLYYPLIKRESKAGNAAEVERLWSEYLDAGGQPTSPILRQILWVYCSVGDIIKAKEVWELIYDMSKSIAINDNIQTSTADIRWEVSMYLRLLSVSGLHDAVIETWTSLQSQGFKFDSHNWNHLAAALVRGGHLEQAFDIMENVILPAERQVQTAYAEARFDEDATLEIKMHALDKLEPPPLEPPLRHRKLRTQAVQSGGLEHKEDFLEDDEVLDADFAHSLKNFEYLAAQEGLWKPHTGVLRTFLIALLKLQRGYPIKPVPVGTLVKNNIAPSEADDRDPAITEPLLQKLYATKPATIERLRAFEEYEKHHHGPISFESIYIRR
ncbi:hypothetical protein D9613_005285 [Agrocybe pediades]|uniref:PROP1-like PPR domain-containing protein n=1 Tax=Agrocybe pediades TaxID=84607 RepID=A0A8H4QYK7_9AGAR|nr:hypothetical protein D9613_005285 [Agrocybe pediades]KAF9569269.1 hypothetical protein CPC08DRAFT_677863 [Agrocybe pediades]